MRAAIARAGSTVPTIEEVPEPAVGAHDVRIRVRAASVNPADIMVASGPARQLFGLPDAVGLGYDAAGEIEALGAEVRGFAIGDRVIGMHADLAAPSRAIAELVVVPAKAVARMPDGLGWEAAATLPLNALTAVQALDLLGEPAGRALLVTGAAGAVGGYAIAAAAAAGWNVHGLARATDRAFIEAAGATLVERLVPSGYDAVFDAAALQERALDAVRDDGAFVGVLPPFPLEPVRGIRVDAVLVSDDDARLSGLAAATAGGSLPARVAAVHPIDALADALTQLASGGLRGRVVLRP